MEEQSFKDMRKYVEAELFGRNKLSLFKAMMLNEGRLDFFDYLFSFNIIAKRPNTLVLSSIYNYFYAYEDFDQAKVIVNLTELNRIPKLMKFLDNISDIPKGRVFCGCFVDNKKNNKIFFKKYAKLFDTLVSLVDNKRLLNREDVISLFNAHNFNIIDMQTINGITYFYAKKQ